LCRGVNDFFFQKIVQLRPQIVVLSADWVEGKVEPIDGTIHRLKQAGVQKVVVIGPVPFWREPLPNLLMRAAIRDNDRVPSSFGSDMYTPGPEAEVKSAAESSGAAYISATGALCPSAACVTMSNYGPQYVVASDEHHLTHAGSQLLLRRIEDRLFQGVSP